MLLQQGVLLCVMHELGSQRIVRCHVFDVTCMLLIRVDLPYEAKALIPELE